MVAGEMWDAAGASHGWVGADSDELVDRVAPEPGQITHRGAQNQCVGTRPALAATADRHGRCDIGIGAVLGVTCVRVARSSATTAGRCQAV
jgi:hypothetical protein